MAAKKFKVSQVAILCSVTTDAIHQARRRGAFPHVKFNEFSGMYEIPRNDVREYLLTNHGMILEEAEEAREKEIKTNE